MSTTSTVDFLHKPGPTSLAELKVTTPTTVVIFGATGDLTARKLLPAFFQLWSQKLLPDALSIVGVARRPFPDNAFRDMMHEAIVKYADAGTVSAEQWQAFASHVHYQQVEFDDPAGYAALARRLEEIETAQGTSCQRLFYLATAPSFFLDIIENLGQVGLIRDAKDRCPSRVIIEKPFGHDLASALQLNRDITRILAEEQIYRIDHYLGKETVLNILSFRFGNAIFETLFNSRHVDHVQITVAESIGMEGRRGAFYETAGALRDVVQNHGLQLLCLAAMEPPAVLTSKGIHDEKVKVLQSLRIMEPSQVARDVVRGQYVAGSTVDGQHVPAYRSEEGVQPRSTTETYVALRLYIDNWRWAGVPFYLRTGKRLPQRVTEIAVQFKQPPLHFFTTVECIGDVCDISQAKPNQLVFRIQPDEGISLIFSAKRPGMLFQIHPVQMDFLYNRSFKVKIPEAYERLLLDALRGDSTLFMRSDEVETAWRYVDPILQAWRAQGAPPLHFYEAGTWGPQDADRLMDNGRSWRTPAV
ncbi:MAG TPA: glucose-6-phosphate dehydrogenase [Phycisphaerae bacterium]|nr:glucose-6-phosphate dehydrogenase [Phycisphaerae bacterium]HOM52126.1 glucose-6-phosphate dehydrogenase [Phycisphaerae bacterium]HOQ85904.1 glucose-6-phosphate dehydrogenase [Phycisphaerae bacterium]HPP27653.1 glucose-6-phosphate dehydrogenase [Phycisphaerae bacterium]HPU27908.1 glucose-6-phosphate dehydrogenase [Phycisphaerae bacterium]